MNHSATMPSSLKHSLGMFDRLARHMVMRQLAGLQHGEIILSDATGASLLGQPGDLQVSLQVHRSQFFREAVLGGTLSVAESYLRGDWDCDHLTQLFRIFIRNQPSMDRLNAGWATLANYAHRLFHWWRANTRSGSRQNIAAHYDLGNDFYRLWLDETLAYSCGIFPTPHATLAEASTEKFDRICRQLNLQPSDDVLEIGTGWGGFALHAAQNYGCHVTTTTISQEQFQLAQQRVAAAGLSDKITLLQQDYRDLQGQYDKLVSIEMIEAVGHKYLDLYFRQCGKLLRPAGSCMLQAIVMPERGYEQYLQSVDFIQRYVFPGGCLPSLGSMLTSVAKSSDLGFVQADDFAPHYAETLRRWRAAFHARLDEVRRLGYSDDFIRLWNYYLCYCEAAFEERSVGVLQIQFDKPARRCDPLDLERPAHANSPPSSTRSAVRFCREPSLCVQ